MPHHGHRWSQIIIQIWPLYKKLFVLIWGNIHSFKNLFKNLKIPALLAPSLTHSLPSHYLYPSLASLTSCISYSSLPPSLSFIASLTSCVSFIISLTSCLSYSSLPPSHSFSLTSCLSYSSLPPSHSLSHSHPASLTPPSLSFIISHFLPLLLLPPSLSFITSLISCLSYSSLPPSPPPLSLSLSTSLFFLWTFISSFLSGIPGTTQTHILRGAIN